MTDARQRGRISAAIFIILAGTGAVLADLSGADWFYAGWIAGVLTGVVAYAMADQP